MQINDLFTLTALNAALGAHQHVDGGNIWNEKLQKQVSYEDKLPTEERNF